MHRRAVSWATALPVAASLLALLPVAASARKPPPPPANPPSTYVRNYANVVGGTERDVTPEDVQATSDGGTIALSLSPSPQGVDVSWLLKRDADGVPQWQEEVGCLSSPPGSFSAGVAVRQTSDGGYVVGGGTIGCGSGNDCPQLSGIQCAFVDKLDATGGLTWSRVYAAGPHGSAIDDLQPTRDGGYVAVGASTGADDVAVPLVVKLDGRGAVQWQRELAPQNGRGELDAVVQAADGSYAASGEFSSSGASQTSVLVVKLDASGGLAWQRGYNDVANGAATAVDHADSIVQTADGGFAAAGSWSTVTSPGSCCRGPLLLKLDASGTLQLQKAYAGHVYCFSNGFSETCSADGGFAYQVRQTADGGYLLAGDATIELRDNAPTEPWLAKLDGSGSVVWQNAYYQTNPVSGRPLSEYFAGAAVTNDGHYSAVGFTENVGSGTGELLGVQTDTSGAVGTCSQVHPAMLLAPTSPGLVPVSSGLSVGTAVAESAASPATRLATTANAFSASQC